VVEWARLAPTTLSVPAELASDIERLIIGEERRRASIEGHRRILGALRQHDPDAAASAAAEHVALVQQHLLRTPQRTAPPRAPRRD
jgi:DNA-binding GntR family transcriptional regulator